MKTPLIAIAPPKWSSILRYALAVAFYILAAIIVLLELKNDTASLILVAIQLARTLHLKSASNAQFIVRFILIVLLIFPSFSLIIYTERQIAWLFIVYTLFFDLFELSTRESALAAYRVVHLPFSLRVKSGGRVLENFLFMTTCLAICSTYGLLVDARSNVGSFIFLAFFSFAIFFAERVFIVKRSRNVAALVLMLFAIVILLYIIFYWSGFGRIVILSWSLIPIIIASNYSLIALRPWYILVILLPSMFLAQISRYGNVKSVEELFGGSAASHLIVTDDLTQNRWLLMANDWGAFVDQYLLIFFNWVPRELWPKKPLGAGLTSVADIYGREGYGDEYSHSLGFVGEQLYLVGYYAPVTLAIVFISLVIVRWAIQRVSSGFMAPVIIFDVGLISYVWGGGATFGSRVWFLLFPCLTAITTVRLFKNEARKSFHRHAAKVVT